jgi:recombination protein RecR
MDAIERLSKLFERFPGIGPRQAQRFVQFLLRSSPAIRREIIDTIRELGSDVVQCTSCQRFHTGSKGLCSICMNPERDRSLLAIVASDVDLLALERSHMFRGLYFVLGGLLSLASDRMSGLRVKELLDSLPKRAEAGLSEIILAFPANPEGDSTAIRVREEITEYITGITVSMLGRGLSTGSELEYADPETLKNALENRH